MVQIESFDEKSPFAYNLVFLFDKTFKLTNMCFSVIKEAGCSTNYPSDFP